MISLASSLARGQIVFFVWVTLTEHKWVILAERRRPGEIPEDWIESGVVDILNVPTSIEVAGAFLPGDKAAVQVNQSATRFPQLLASLPESCQHPMTPRIKGEPILKLRPSDEMHTGRKVTVG